MKPLHLLLLVFFSATALAAPERKPNVLIFLVDDQGYGQPGCYGGKVVPTPNMDALARNGVRCTNGYDSGCVCSPTRVGLMTGRYQQHTGHDGLCGRPGNELLLSETLMSQRMKEAGYTTAIIGKWHLGATNPTFLPISRGFDYSIGSVSNLAEEGFYKGAELMDEIPGAPITSPVYAKEACDFLQRTGDQPWFLYLPFNAVHAPHVASEKWLEKFKNLPKNDAVYAAMNAEVDEAIGTVMEKLRAVKQEENTLIFLLSDNGGAYAGAEMAGLRGHKWLVWEGGIRVPWIAQWKGHIPAGRVLDTPVIQLDILPTALAAAGVTAQPAWKLDGLNILPLLEGKTEKVEREALYWRFGVQYAVRQGDWKLVKAGLSLPPMLVNLAKDPGEQTDLSTQEPAKAKALQALWDQWNASMQPPRWQDPRWNGEEFPRGKAARTGQKKGALPEEEEPVKK